MVKNVIIIILSNFLIFLVYNSFQEKISINENLGYDGVYYYKMSEQFQEHKQVTTDAPFVYRIGTPFIASLFTNIKLAYFYINIFSAILSSILIYFLFIKYFNFKLSVILSILYQLHWISGIRYILFDSISVDFIALNFLFVGLILIKSNLSNHKKIIFLLVLTLFGVFFREIAFIPAIIYFISNFRQERKSSFPLISGIILLLILHLTIIKTNSYHGIENAIKWFYIKGIGTYLLSIFNVYGLLILIPIIFYKDMIKFYLTNKEIYLSFAMIMILALIGGSDTERILSWSLPFFYIIAFQIIDSRKIYSQYLMLVIFVSLIFTYRVFWSIPADVENTKHILPFITYISNDFNFADLLAYHGLKKYTSIQLVEYLSLFTILYYLMKRRFNGNK